MYRYIGAPLRADRVPAHELGRAGHVDFQKFDNIIVLNRIVNRIFILIEFKIDFLMILNRLKNRLKKMSTQIIF